MNIQKSCFSFAYRYFYPNIICRKQFKLVSNPKTYVHYSYSQADRLSRCNGNDNVNIIHGNVCSNCGYLKHNQNVESIHMKNIPKRKLSYASSYLIFNDRDRLNTHSSIFKSSQSSHFQTFEFVSRSFASMSNGNGQRLVEDMSVEEKVEKFNRPKAQTTIDEQEIDHFSALSSLWWDEGGEFEALHTLNELRIPLIRDALMAHKRLDQYQVDKPLEGFWILDVGSGGGLLSEPLARLGASVIGVEVSEENIKIAQAHLMHDESIQGNIKYIQSTVEDIAETQAGKFDAVVASEVLEHVADADMFVSAACKLVRPGGSIFLTTINKTYASYALGIVMAEHILKLVSPGTHDWKKFISPLDLQYILEKNDFSTRLVHGMWYNPLTKRWSWTKDKSINYAIHAVKSEDVPIEEKNVWTEK